LHLSIEKRWDELTMYLLENSKADLTVKDNTGVSPLDVAGKTPVYHRQLADLLDKRIAAERTLNANNPIIPEPVQEMSQEEQAIQFYLKTGSYYTFFLNGAATAATAIKMIAEKACVEDIGQHLELCEEVMGKERKLKETELVLASKEKWPNENPTYCKFLVKLKRGSPGKHTQESQQATNKQQTKLSRKFPLLIIIRQKHNAYTCR